MYAGPQCCFEHASNHHSIRYSTQAAARKSPNLFILDDGRNCLNRGETNAHNSPYQRFLTTTPARQQGPTPRLTKNQKDLPFRGLQRRSFIPIVVTHLSASRSLRTSPQRTTTVSLYNSTPSEAIPSHKPPQTPTPTQTPTQRSPNHSYLSSPISTSTPNGPPTARHAWSTRYPTIPIYHLTI